MIGKAEENAMPENQATGQDASAIGACSGCPTEQELKMCMNCRKAVEESLTRIAGRRLRRLRRNPECSVAKCVEFLNGIDDRALRFHLASMAWWRFSSDGGVENSEPVRTIMVESAIEKPAFGIPYMHSVLRLLSPLSQDQLTAWFGHDNLHQIASFYGGVGGWRDGVHCQKCRLYGQGCTMHNLLGADDCPLWDDEYVQRVAKAIDDADGWHNPCREVKEDE